MWLKIESVKRLKEMANLDFSFFEPDEFDEIRKNLADLRADIETMDEGSAPVVLPASPEALRIRGLQLLLLELRYRNQRAKMVLDELCAHTPETKHVSIITDNRDPRLPPLTIENFDGYTETLE
jgi:hypothetical protein